LTSIEFPLVWSTHKKLRSKKFNSNDGIKENVLNWLRHQDKDFFATGINKLI